MRWCATEREKAQRVRFAKRVGMAFPVMALAKGSKASKGAKDCFTELRTAEALPPHQRFAPTRRSGHCRLPVATPPRGNPLTLEPLLPLLPEQSPPNPIPFPLAKPIPAFARSCLCIAASRLVFTSPMVFLLSKLYQMPCGNSTAAKCGGRGGTYRGTKCSGVQAAGNAKSLPGADDAC